MDCPWSLTLASLIPSSATMESPRWVPQTYENSSVYSSTQLGIMDCACRPRNSESCRAGGVKRRISQLSFMLWIGNQSWLAILVSLFYAIPFFSQVCLKKHVTRRISSFGKPMIIAISLSPWLPNASWSCTAPVWWQRYAFRAYLKISCYDWWKC